jgi:hypothetical protein
MNRENLISLRWCLRRQVIWMDAADAGPFYSDSIWYQRYLLTQDHFTATVSDISGTLLTQNHFTMTVSETSCPVLNLRTAPVFSDSDNKYLIDGPSTTTSLRTTCSKPASFHIHILYTLFMQPLLMYTLHRHKHWRYKVITTQSYKPSSYPRLERFTRTLLQMEL